MIFPLHVAVLGRIMARGNRKEKRKRKKQIRVLIVLYTFPGICPNSLLEAVILCLLQI
jgi:hypothetical protein